jgi:AAA ATPase-like protein
MLVGRETELEILRGVLDEAGPLVVFIHGIGGIGKTAILEAFTAGARASGAIAVQLDGGSIEPTASGFLAALSAATGRQLAGIEDATGRLAILGPRVVVAIDRYEFLRPIDLWFRHTFVPALSDTVRVVVAGRDRPIASWALDMGRLFRSLPVANLAREDAIRLLLRLGVSDDAIEPAYHVARGHPLSLRLAASALGAGPTIDPDQTTITAIVDELTRLYLEHLDPLTRHALDAASVVRRPTITLLATMLPESGAQDLFERLRQLPFIELGIDGLVVHDTIREAVAGQLRSSDPARSRMYRIAAWRQLRDEMARASRQEMRRYAADLLYILENPTIREAYFPTTEHEYVIGPPGSDELPVILELSRRQYPDESVAIVTAWWNLAPWAFRMARDAAGRVVGFSVLTEFERIPRTLFDADPVARRWREHLRLEPIPRGQRCLAYRFERADPGDPSETVIHAAFFLDLVRANMELRPDLRRLYQASPGIFGKDDVETKLGVVRIPGRPVEIPNGRSRYVYWLDFGTGSVDAWLTRMVATELQIEEDPILDSLQRQLVLDDRRVDLTRLEFEVIHYLHERPGRIVDRAALLGDIWGYEDGRGSNVLEVIVTSLRRKLGERAAMIETVRGVGYRFIGSA